MNSRDEKNSFMASFMLLLLRFYEQSTCFVFRISKQELETMTMPSDSTSFDIMVVPKLRKMDRLLEWCAYDKLSVTYTFFNTRHHQWISTNHQGQIIGINWTYPSQLRNVFTTSNYHSTVCYTDNILDCSIPQITRK